MFAVKGTYKDGMVFIREKIRTETPVNVIVTFLDDIKAPVEEKINLNKFSFKKSKKLLAGYDGALSDTIVEERRSAV